MIAERFQIGWKKKETHQVFYIVPDHIKFTAEMEMIWNVGELLSNSTNREVNAFLMRLQVYSLNVYYGISFCNEAITEKISIFKVGITMLFEIYFEEHSDELLLFKNEARHKGFLWTTKQSNEWISIRRNWNWGFLKLFEATNPTENEQRLKEFGIIYRYSYRNALKQDFVHQEESYAQLCCVIASKDLSNTLYCDWWNGYVIEGWNGSIEALVGSGATVGISCYINNLWCTYCQEWNRRFNCLLQIEFSWETLKMDQ